EPQRKTIWRIRKRPRRADCDGADALRHGAEALRWALLTARESTAILAPTPHLNEGTGRGFGGRARSPSARTGHSPGARHFEAGEKGRVGRGEAHRSPERPRGLRHERRSPPGAATQGGACRSAQAQRSSSPPARVVPAPRTVPDVPGRDGASLERAERNVPLE